MKKLILWFCNLRRIVRRYDREVQHLHERISQLETLIRERTDIAVSAGFRQDSYIVVMGRYRGADYVETFRIADPALDYIVEILKSICKTADAKIVDAPPSFREVIKNQL